MTVLLSKQLVVRKTAEDLLRSGSLLMDFLTSFLFTAKKIQGSYVPEEGQTFKELAFVGPFVGFRSPCFILFQGVSASKVKIMKRKNTNKNGPKTLVLGPKIGCGGRI
jgi:hypothetical protein